jgi:hypothetical protein
MPIRKIRRYRGYKIKLGYDRAGYWYFDVYAPWRRFVCGSTVPFATAQEALGVARHNIGVTRDYLNRNLQQ